MNSEEIYSEVVEEKYPPVDVSKFVPITDTEILEVLGKTIKRDDTNKLITFLALLSAYTEDSQLNISFNAPSSSGKSFIPTQIAKLFSREDVIQVGYCSPTAFFHDVGEFSEEKQGYIVDLSKKILIFLDQPHTLLLQHLRPMLSHDEKEIQIKITDKGQKKGLKTKNIYLIGYPVVIFCSAGLNLDEQEATRFLLLSPEVNQGKIKDAVFEKIKKDSDSATYASALEKDPQRKLLKERILAIKEENIQEIIIPNPELVKDRFVERITSFKPRHQRDIGRITSLIKVFALCNLWFRERKGNVIFSNDEDIVAAFKIWDEISESQELNLPPYVYNLYKDVIVEAYRDRNGELDGIVRIGLTRQDIVVKHNQVYSRHIADWFLRQCVIPPLLTSGLIIQEPDPADKRRWLIYPTTTLTNSTNKNNSEFAGVVEEEIYGGNR